MLIVSSTLNVQYYWLGDKAAFSDVQQSKGYVDKERENHRAYENVWFKYVETLLA